MNISQKTLFVILLLFPFWGGCSPDSSRVLPPIEMLTGDSELKYIYDLPEHADYKIFDEDGAEVARGEGQFIDFTDYSGGTYFIHYNGQIEVFKKEIDHRSSIIWLGVIAAVLILCISFFFFMRLRRIKREQSELLSEIHLLKKEAQTSPISNLTGPEKVILDKTKIEQTIDSKLNESDWNIIQRLVNNPTISNKKLVDEVALSVEGTRSSLKKMYRIFEIPSSRNMRLTLVMKLIQIAE